MGQICAQFGITRQAHYHQVKRELQRQFEEEIILEMVRQVRRKHPRLGTRKMLEKIQPWLAVEGIQIGRDRLFSLLRERDLLVKHTKAYRRTTIPGHRRTPNLLPGMVISQPNQVWVCDITYLEVEMGRFAYLFLLMDLYSRFIVGWHVASSLTADGAVNCLRMALKQLPKMERKLIHHSDHGVQYTSRPYMEILIRNSIHPSMGEVGNCYDNIFVERVIGTLKNEYYLDARFSDHHQVRSAAMQAIHNYNTDRPHLSLGMAVPHDVYFGFQQNVLSVTIPESDYASTNI
jgi:transposase InsO family protein